jgi:hypothetical protein
VNDKEASGFDSLTKITPVRESCIETVAAIDKYQPKIDTQPMPAYLLRAANQRYDMLL